MDFSDPIRDKLLGKIEDCKKALYEITTIDDVSFEARRYVYIMLEEMELLVEKQNGELRCLKN